MKEELEVEHIEPQALVIRERSSVRLVPVMNVEDALAGLHEFQRFIDKYLEESADGGASGDYGVIQGTKKKTLLKSGADKLCEVYGLYDEYEIKSTVNWETGLFDYEVKCLLKSRRDDSVVGTGLGCCSSFESKYRWRESQRLCPHCHQPAIIKGKDFKGDGQPTGWLCFGKKGGCGAKFKDGDKSIEGQVVGRIDNPDIVDIKNTVLKMAKKRAKIDATIGATRSSGILTQDIEDIQPEKVTPKPEPPKNDKDIEFGSRETEAATTPKGAAQQAPEVPGADCIESGQAVNFHRLVKDALRSKYRKQAEEIVHDWLRRQGIVDVLGKPSALAIKKANFYEVREAAVNYAAGYDV